MWSAGGLGEIQDIDLPGWLVGCLSTFFLTIRVNIANR